MIKNYLKLAWRTLAKNKVFSVIIISGLTLAYTSCIVIYLHVRNETSYDKHNQDYDRIFRVVKDFVNDDNSFLPDATTPPALAWAIKQEIPEVEEVTKLIPNWGSKFLVRYGDKVFYEKGRYRADSSILKIFSYKFLEGNSANALSKPQSVIISRSMEKKYFGDEQALGKTIEIGEGENRAYAVTGVIEDIPEQSHFHFDFLISLSSNSVRLNSNWSTYTWYTYIKLKPGSSIEQVEPKIIALYKKNDANSNYRYYTQPLTDIHLQSKLKWELGANGDITFVKIFVIVGIFILLIASINYINLSISLSFNRSKEVGIRKVSGADNGKLIYQFLTESMLTNVVSILVAIALVEALLPILKQEFGANILGFTQQPLEVTGLIIGTALLIGLLSGLYPSLYLSAFKPAQVLKGVFQPGNQNLWLRKGLVVLQFTVSIALIAGTILVVQQVNFIRARDLGFEKEKVLVIENLANLDDTKVQNLRDAFLQASQVENVGGSSGIFAGQNATTGAVVKGSKEGAIINFAMVDHDYLSVMNLQFKHGRNFSREFPSDTIDRVILNEAALRDLGITGNPVGMLITDNPGAEKVRYFTVLGVVKDFHFANLRDEIKPYMFLLDEKAVDNFAVKISSTDLHATLDALKNTWNSIEPDRPFQYFFLDENLEKLYKADENFKIVFSALTIGAIYIACSGLFAIATFFIRRRTKEIGIRKVMGASVAQITWLVSAEFIFIVLLANLMAWPIAWYGMDSWLSGFAYRIQIGAGSFLIAGVLAILMAAMTISFQSIKSAFANPVDSLRND
jgi:putative ABC transport system permease protein